MEKQEKILATVLRRTSDANLSFDEIRSLLLHLGFEERIRGSHPIYRKQGVEEKINIQSSGGKTKP
jgi:predicted RNA binding protein YcfA (HicA-like mRNA interferase family)